jgi:hypothetical protein
VFQFGAFLCLRLLGPRCRTRAANPIAEAQDPEPLACQRRGTPTPAKDTGKTLVGEVACSRSDGELLSANERARSNSSDCCVLGWGRREGAHRRDERHQSTKSFVDNIRQPS